jgi:hypothetical protein
MFERPRLSASNAKPGSSILSGRTKATVASISQRDNLGWWETGGVAMLKRMLAGMIVAVVMASGASRGNGGFWEDGGYDWYAGI